MSMTMIAFYQKVKTPSKSELQSQIEKLNFDFKFLEEFDKIDQFGGACQLNGKETFFETYIQSKEEILEDYPFLNKSIGEFDSGISFIWGSDFIAGACIGIIGTSLMDLCGAKLVYVDDETWYTRKMLLDEIPIFIEEHEKQNHKSISNSSQSKRNKKTKWLEWTLLGLMIISGILMARKLISWYLLAISMALYIGHNIWTENKKRR